MDLVPPASPIIIVVNPFFITSDNSMQDLLPLLSLNQHLARDQTFFDVSVSLLVCVAPNFLLLQVVLASSNACNYASSNFLVPLRVLCHSCRSHHCWIAETNFYKTYSTEHAHRKYLHGKNVFLKNYQIVRKLRIWEKFDRFYRTLQWNNSNSSNIITEFEIFHCKIW